MSPDRPAGGGPPRGPASRVVRYLGQGVAAVVGLLLLAAAGGLLLATQTAAGRAAAADFLEDALSGTVDGRVEVGAITGGNLFTRAVVDHFRISGPRGEPFLELRDVRLGYSPLGLLVGDYRLRRARAGRLELHLIQDADGSWNYDRLFGGDGDDDGDDDGDGARLTVTDLTVEDGRFEVRTPWAEDLTGAARDSAVSAALGGEEVWRFEETPDGLQRVITLEELSGGAPFLRIVHPTRPMRLEFQQMQARARAVRQPLRIERMDAAVTFTDTVRVELGDVRTANSRLSGRGSVVPGDPVRYDFDLRADRLSFAELQWLPIPVPEEGGGEGQLRIRTSDADPEVMVVGVTEGDFTSGDSRATGAFTVRLTEMPRLEDVDLDLRPLRLSLAQRLIEQEGAPDGYVEGRVAGSGPLDLFDVDADVEIRRLPAEERSGAGDAGGTAVPPDPDSSPRDTADRAGGGGAREAPATDPPAFRVPSRLVARGGVGLVGEERRLRDLRLEFTDFAPRWTRLVEIDTRQRGRLDGTLTLDRVPEGRVAVEADLRHRLPGDTASRITGSGSVEGNGDVRVDVSFRADPLSLSVLDPYFPAVEMVGVVRGPVSASGTLSDLRADADLVTPRGELRFDGSFDLAAERKRYDARVTARGIQVDQWLERGLATDLDVQGRVRGEGTDPATIAATFDLEILPSMVEGARVDSSLLRFTVEEGLARVDTFSIRSEVGTVRGRGGFGLSSDRSASLVLDLSAPDLSRWNRWVVPGRRPAAGDTARDDLFRILEDEEEAETVARPDTLAGSLTAQGVAYGNLEDFGVGGHLEAGAARYGDHRADSLRVVLDATDARSLDSLELSGWARGLETAGQAVDSLSFRLQRTGGTTADVELLALRSDAEVSGSGNVEWSEERQAADLRELTLRMHQQRLRLARAARIAYGDTGLSVEDLALVGRAGTVRLRADGILPRSGEARFDARLDSVSVDGLRRLAGLAEEAKGALSGELRVRGTATAPRMDGSLRVDGPGLDSLRYRVLDGTFRYRDGRLDLDTSLRGEAGPLVRIDGGIRADLSLVEVADRIPERPLDLRVRADSLPLELLLSRVSTITDVEGSLAATTRVRGAADALELEGEGRIRRGAGYVPELGVRYREVEGGLRFRGSEIRLDNLSLVSSAGGRGSASGAVSIRNLGDPGFDLSLRARELRAIDRRKASVVVDGSGRLGGSYSRPELTGEFRMSDGTLREEELLQSDEVVDLTDPRLYSLLDTTAVAERRILARIQNPFMQNLRTDVALQLGPDLWLRSPTLAVEITGQVDVRMDRAAADISVFGTVSLVRGNYRWTTARGAFSRQLRITEGQIEFVGTPGVNPNLDITAAHRVRSEQGTIVVEVNITGTMLQPQLSLTSEPPLDQTNQVCVLIINSPCAAQGRLASQVVADQLLGQVGAELSSILAGGGGPEYVTVQSAGGALGVDQPGLGGTGERETFLAGKELELGWYLGPELFITLNQPLGSRAPGGLLDWRFAEAWSLELRTEQRFAQDLGRSTSSNLDTERLWGLFLFREWSF